MAGITEYATATGNDYAEHERTYAAVMKLSKIGTAMAVLIVISLAIGGVTGPWWLCGLGVVLSIVGGVIGAVSEKGTILPIGLSALLVVALWYIV
ncbi:aa3-type cytochrome c oxidase subunit IV [Methylopila henanensis]|uniref:Aa3-type cytochrome c oxidase subunit IV n=1 Tax=Methylopila henanensis TaxID=873516 RepID=A0ABW4K9A7_9HYPH